MTEFVAFPKKDPPRRGRLKDVAIVIVLLLVGSAGLSLAIRARENATNRERTRQAIAALDRDDPGWRLEQLEARRKTVPDARNSAPIVGKVADLLPKEWPYERAVPVTKDTGPRHPTRERWFESRIPTDPHVPLAPEFADEVRVELKALAPALAEARKVADYPEGRYPLHFAANPIETPMPHAQQARQPIWLLRLDAMLRAQEGDADGALESCRAMMNVGRSLGDEPYTISQLVRIAGNKLALAEVERAIALGQPTDAALAKMQDTLSGELESPLFEIAARGERAMMFGLYEALASGRIDSFTSQDAAFGPAARWLYAQARFVYAERVVLEESNELVKIAKGPDYLVRERFDEFDRALRQRSAASGVDGWARMFLTGLSGFVESCVTYRAKLVATMTAVAAERYRLAHGAWPRGVEDLAPEFLKSAPRDPCLKDGPPRLRAMPDGLLVYSVGYDGVDDGGVAERAGRPKTAEARRARRGLPPWKGVDITIRLWDPTARRQPPAVGPAEEAVGSNDH